MEKFVGVIFLLIMNCVWRIRGVERVRRGWMREWRIVGKKMVEG